MPERRRLPLIPAAKVSPKKHTIFQMGSEMEGPLLKTEGGTEIEWLCGACDRVLTTGLQPSQVQGIVIRCSCGVYNDATI